MDSYEESIAFNNTFKNIVSDLLNEKLFENLKEVMIWMNKVIEYNVPNGKRNRGLIVVQTFRLLTENQNRQVDKESLDLARKLGWIVEIFIAAVLMMDDLMDQSITRRGQKCWYSLEQVGLISVNDAILLQEINFQIDKIYFSDKSYYHQLVDLMHEISRLSSYGQCLDMSANLIQQKPDIKLFTKSRYNKICKYKTAYCTYVYPVRMAMYMCSECSTRSHNICEKILLKLGQLFQVQDDYLDCFGDTNITGKIGKDIEDGKCCWPIITALKYCSINQLEMLKLNYGLNRKNSVKLIKKTYNNICLKNIYLLEEQLLYRDICYDIDEIKLNKLIIPTIFSDILNKIYRRNK